MCVFSCERFVGVPCVSDVCDKSSQTVRACACVCVLARGLIISPATHRQDNSALLKRPRGAPVERGRENIFRCVSQAQIR